MEQNTQETRELTFGEKLVGKTFNPSKDPDVDRLKDLAAEMADIVAKSYSKRPVSTHQDLLFNNAMQQILSGQMAAVKLVTNQF